MNLALREQFCAKTWLKYVKFKEQEKQCKDIKDTLSTTMREQILLLLVSHIERVMCLQELQMIILKNLPTK